MSEQRWQRIEEICHEALERAPDERAVFVREACAGDEALRAEVESLLANQSRADALGSGLGIRDSGLGMSTDELIGKQIGVYQIDSLLGAGGMGEVYRARDTKLGRDVAIKILPRGVHDRSRSAARASSARRACWRRCNHPNIGAIYGLEEPMASARSCWNWSRARRSPTHRARAASARRRADDRATDRRRARRRPRERASFTAI